MTVNILGTPYTIETKKNGEDSNLDRNDWCGYCDFDLKKIVLSDLATKEGWKDESEEKIRAGTKTTLRHEIVHAFLDESGLQGDSNIYGGPWAQHEEMVDWWAIQGPKVYQAWKEADAL